MTAASGDPGERERRIAGMTPQVASSTVSPEPTEAFARAVRDHDPQSLCELLESVGENRDKAAFCELFAFFAPRLKSFFKRGGAPDAASEEMVQETLLLVWRKAALFDAAIAGASTWIYTIARNHRIDRLRRERRFTPLEDHMLDAMEPEEPKGDEIVFATQVEVRLHAAIQDLPPEQVEVLQLSFFENQSHSEIAGRLKLPMGTVKSRLRLAFGKLRNTLEDLRE